MARLWQVFLRVLRSYTIEEKVLSVVLSALVFFVIVQGLVTIFRTPGFFVAENGIYTEGLVSERPAVLNPLYVDFSEPNREMSALVFSGLTKYDPKLKAFVEDLAQLTISDDRKTYHFVLRDGVFWHDGTSLTMDDVYYTFHDVIQNPDFQNPVIKANFDGVEVKELDQKTIEFVLQRPNSFFITNLNVGILPKHVLKDVAVVDLKVSNFNLKPIGSGAYKVDGSLESLSDDRQRVLLTAFDKYYGDHPKIKNIRFNIYPTSQALLKEKGTLNVISKVGTDVYDELELSNRISFQNYELPQYTAVFMNMDSPILKNDKVRLALLKAVDKDQLMKLFINKLTVDTPLLELNQKDWIYKSNVDEAKGSLFDAGYKIDKVSGYPYRKDDKGNELKLVLLARAYDSGTVQQDETQKTVDFFKKAWADVGVNLDVQLELLESFNDRLSLRDYDLVLTGQSMGYNLDTFSYWHSSQVISTGLNLSNYKSFAADALIENIRDTFDPEKKTELQNQLAKTISADIPAIFLYRPSYVFGTDGKVKGVNLENLAFPSDRFAHVADWCIECS